MNEQWLGDLESVDLNYGSTTDFNLVSNALAIHVASIDLCLIIFNVEKNNAYFKVSKVY